MDDKNMPKEIQIELNEQVAEGVYANLVIIGHSDSEFIFDFARFLPGRPKAKIHSRIIMNPKNAKLFLKAFQENIAKFESQFGSIKGGDEVKPRFGIHGDDESGHTVN